MRRTHKFENISQVVLTLLSNVKIRRDIFFSNVVAFSQYLNFENVKYLESRHSNDRGNGDENTVGTRFERRKKALFAIKVKWGRVLWW